MKHLKTKLVSAIAMLAVAAIMMTSATYAWFTISTNPEVKGVEANVTANGNLEIALDGGSHAQPAESTTADYGKNTTWGNMVDVGGLFNNAGLTLKPTQLIASSSVYPTFKYPVYGNDGRVKKLAALTEYKVADDNDINYGDFGGIKLYASSDVSDATSSSINTDSASIYAFEVDYWLRTNIDGNLLLKSSAIKRDNKNMSDGSGSKLSIDGVTILMVTSSAGSLKYYEAVRSGGTDEDTADYLKLYDVTVNDTNGTWTRGLENTTGIAMTANTAREIRMYVFMNGEKLTNADAQQTLTKFTMSVQFMLDKDLEAMNVNPQ